MILNGNIIISANTNGIVISGESDLPLYQSNVTPIIVNDVYYFPFTDPEAINYLILNVVTSINAYMIGGGGGGGAAPMGAKAFAAGGGSGEVVMEIQEWTSIGDYIEVIVGAGGNGGLLQPEYKHPHGFNGKNSYIRIMEEEVVISEHEALGGGGGGGIDAEMVSDFINGVTGGSAGGAAVADKAIGVGYRGTIGEGHGTRYVGDSADAEEAICSTGGGGAGESSVGPNGGTGIQVVEYIQSGMPGDVAGGGCGISIVGADYGLTTHGANQGKQGSENTGAGGSAWYADKEGYSRDGNAGGSGVVVIKFSIK